MEQPRREGTRKGKRAGKVSLWGQSAPAAFDGNGDGGVAAAAAAGGDDGERGDGVGGDAPREPRCRTACSRGTRTQSEVPRRRH